MTDDTGGGKLVGKRVRMTQALKEHLVRGCSQHHVEEFGDCVGVVRRLANWGEYHGPEVDVCWEPSGLVYAYPHELLEVVE